MSERKINVLVADDSSVVRALLLRLLEADPEIRVVGAVANGQSAIDFIKRDKPDVVLMDIHMPHIDGFEATRHIMETTPLPIVICSAVVNTKDVVVTFRAMEAGALACVEKPVAPGHRDFEEIAAELVKTVKLMSEVKVVRRIRRRPTPAAAPASKAQPVAPPTGDVRVVGIGASTGGPPVLQTILRELPATFPVPVLVVQHIAHGFIAGMAEWLRSTTGLPIHVPAHGTQPSPGHVYLAPDDFHMGVGADGAIELVRGERENHLRPAVSYLFRSIAQHCGPNAIGVLLTGMGRDGAEELKLMRDQGASTIAQDQASSAVHGMPGVAIALGGASHVLPGDRISAALIELVNGRGERGRASG